MRIQNGHAHAYTRFKLINFLDYILLLRSVFECKIYRCKSLTVHLPYELQHMQVENLNIALRFIKFGEIIKNIFKVKVFWENAPLLETNNWSLRYSQTEWDKVPVNIDLCLDTGHLILGAENKKQARKRIRDLLKKRGRQIKHLHIHENNLVSDLHLRPKSILTKKLLEMLKKNRTFIYEKSV